MQLTTILRSATPPHTPIIGRCATFRAVLDSARLAAESNAAVLIEGETGTGKELVAAWIHEHCARRQGRFVKVNCAAIHDGLSESELFGHERGAFTGAERQRIGRFELADRGTLFLDEIGDMSPGMQAKMLRALQNGEFERLGGTRTLKADVRVVAATNRDLRQMITDGLFRKDLFFRLSVICLELPPLRQRREDIQELTQYFLQRAVRNAGRQVDGFEPAARDLLSRHSWPGNVRELENVIERAVVMTSGRLIPASALQLESMSVPGEQAVRLPATGIPLEEIERQALVQALQMSGWVQKDAARLLSISPRAMHYKIRTLNITRPCKRLRAVPPREVDTESESDPRGDAGEPWPMTLSASPGEPVH
jgi:transcriptional regulator with GAF, ATPase, and Fis domain